MGLEVLNSREVQGMIFARLEQDAGAGWVGRVANLYNSDQASEKYGWIGQVPSMRQWIGGRQAKGLSTYSVTIENLDFEATLKVLKHDLMRHKVGQLQVRIGELATRANAHWAQLLSALIAAGDSSNAYDGKKFFAKNHSEGKSGTLANLIDFTCVDAENPTAGELADAIGNATTQLFGLKDNEGEPINENARQFLVMCKPSYFMAASAAIRNNIIIDGSTSRTNTLTNIPGYTFDLEPNARLTAAGDHLWVFRTDADTRALIMQQEQDVEVSALAEGSEEEFKHNHHLYGIHAIRNVGYGFWQRAVQVDLATSS